MLPFNIINIYNHTRICITGIPKLCWITYFNEHKVSFLRQRAFPRMYFQHDVLYSQVVECINTYIAYYFLNTSHIFYVESNIIV